MRAGGGKAKGSAFERLICKRLSLWVTAGRKEDCFWRSAMSGGRATVGRKVGKTIRQAGDITAVSPEGHVLTDWFYIEAKFYKNLDIDSFLIERRGTLANFWDDTVIHASHYNRSPMLIVKENRRYPLVIVDATIELFCNPRCLLRIQNGPGVYFWEDILGTPYVPQPRALTRRSTPRPQPKERIDDGTRATETQR